MTRAGLTVGAAVLDAAEALAETLSLERESRWGMSPFGGIPKTDPVWSAIDARGFLRGEERYTNHQSAFRLAYELPPVALVVVGTDDASHLRDLVRACALEVDADKVRRYRALLRARRNARSR